jgi:2-aminoadipate transaminase
MFIWARAKAPALDAERLLEAGLARGVCVSPSSVFDPLGRDRGAIRINFTYNSEDRLEEGARRLALAAGDLMRAAA